MHDQLITAVSIATVLTIGQGGSALIRIVRHVWKRRPRFRY